jgi:hypothetical protein
MSVHVIFEGKLVCLCSPPCHCSNDTEIPRLCGIHAIRLELVYGRLSWLEQMSLRDDASEVDFGGVAAG